MSMIARITTLLLLLATPLAAQVRESIEVRVMELEATVLDRSGRPVEGLTREDFQVHIGKRTVPVTNFFIVRNGAIVDDDVAAGFSRPRDGLKPVAASTSIPTSLVIFIDELHLSAGSRKRAIEALQRYVGANVGSQTTATLIRYNKHLDVRVRPTEKPGYIVAELEKLAREPFVEGASHERQRIIEMIEAVLLATNRRDNSIAAGSADVAGESPDTIFYRLEEYADRCTSEVDRTLAALEDAVALTSGFTGRKVLLYVSDGLPQQPALELFEYWDRVSRRATNTDSRSYTEHAGLSRGMRFDRTAELRRVAQAAQRANVAIYSFDAGGARGFEGRSVDAATTIEKVDTTMFQTNLRGGLEYVAGETGGLYVANENDIDRVLARMSEQFSSYYSIGVSPARGDIRITVKNRPELRVIATKRRPPRTREDELQQSVRTRLYTRATENPLNAALELGTASRIDGQCVVAVRLDVRQPKLPPELTPEAVDLRMVMLNEQNDESPVQHVRVPLAAGQAAHSMMLRVRPERHVLSLAVSNPLSGESSYLQKEIDATTCR